MSRAMRDELRAALTSARAVSTTLTSLVDDRLARVQGEPGISPVGWHMGQVAWQE